MANTWQGAFPHASVKPRRSMASFATAAHSWSFSSLSPTGLLSDRCHTWPGPGFASGTESPGNSGAFPATTLTRLAFGAPSFTPHATRA